MCGYCKLIETGVTGEKTNDNVSMAKIKDGSQVFELNLWRYINEEDDDRENELVLDMSVDIDSSVYVVKRKHIKIKYCPFCGEEL